MKEKIQGKQFETEGRAEGENPWEGLRGVEFAGDSEEEQEKEERERNAEKGAQELRELTNWRAKAEREDPQGFAEAVAKDAEINVKKEQARQEVTDGWARYQELESKADEIIERRTELKGLREEKQRSKLYKFKTKIGMQDRQMAAWEQELDQLDEQDKERFALVTRGYGSEESVEARLDGIGEDSYEHEEDFVDKFVSPLEKEQKRELLKFDNLAKLSTREYLDLWKGLNPYYLSHVTRQGYRDHTGMAYHTAGFGEFQDDFRKIIGGDGRLHSTWEMATGEGMMQVKDADAVEKYFETTGVLTKKLSSVRDEDLDSDGLAKVLGGAHGVLNKPDGYWQDQTSVHFMANAVGNEKYGGEDGNEVFFVYPADVLASQCCSSTGLALTDNAKNKGQVPWRIADDHNDSFVMPRENGIPLDAGLVFLPKNILVNPENGSKYLEYDEENPVYADEKTGVRAEEYWEKYFGEHPEVRPAHVIYYEGEPQAAVSDLLEKEGIVLGGAGDLNDGKNYYDCGFRENVISNLDRLESKAKDDVKKEQDSFFAAMAEYVKKKKEI